jgi:hypothetical protein
MPRVAGTRKLTTGKWRVNPQKSSLRGAGLPRKVTTTEWSDQPIHSEVGMSSAAFRNIVCGGISSAFLLSVSPSSVADALDNWTTNQVSTNWFGLTHVVFGNGRYVAAGYWSDYGAILSSEDGLNWTLRVGSPDGPLTDVTSLAFGGDRFLVTGAALGNSSGVSTNGIDWSIGGAGYIPSNVHAMSYGAGTYVLVCDAYFSNSNNMYYSNNGTNWTPAFKIPAEARSVWDVAFGASRFVAVADGGFAYTSFDGTVWQRGTIPGGTSIMFAAGRFLVPLNAGINLISSDGATWAAIGTGLTNALGKVAFANGVFFARAGNYLASSNDGTNWTQRTSSTLPGNGGIASDGRRFVNVGRELVSGPSYYNSYVYTSDPFVALEITNRPPPQLVLSGIVGRSYRIEYLPSLPSSLTNPWQTLANLVLPVSPHFLADPEAPDSLQRYYRAVLLP